MSTRVKAGALAMAIALGTTACSPFTRIRGDDATATRLDGGWTVTYHGSQRLEGVMPAPTIVFDTTARTVSGFDGCHRFQGSYAFVDGRLKAKVSGTPADCASEAARAASEQMAKLFADGAEVVEASIGQGRVVLLRDGPAELRLAPTETLALR